MKKLVSIILALVLVSVLSVSAFAEVSPVAPIEKTYEGGTATITTVPSSPSQFIYEATAKDGYKFVGWEIEGAYAPADLDLTKPTITITLEDGTVVVPVFEKIDDTVEPTEPEDEEPEDEEPEDDGKKPVSPGTGDSMAMLALAVAAFGGAVISKKRLSK
ncbi:MAG: hypothetical protein IJD90_04830 [Clostridia bacterium]|nr:hypothetical protein [Clostridia bacterium]